MKSFTTAIALFAAAACVSAAPAARPLARSDTNDVYVPKGMFKHEPGARPGFYTHHLALDGTVHTQYHGATNPTASNSTSTPPAQRRGDTGVHCGSLAFNADDGTAATQGLANSFGSQPQFYHAVSYTSGTAVAYGCDYGHGQGMSGVEFTGYINDVAYDCGAGKQGWYALPDAKAAYGITTTGSGFC